MESLSEKELKIVIVGPPCSGKSTLSRELAQALKAAPLGFRDLCDVRFLRNDDLKDRWLYYSQNSLPFDAELTCLAEGLVADQIKRCPRFVLEGYPKRLGEVAHLLSIIGQVDCLILLNPMYVTMKTRWRWRVQCPKCRRTFSLQEVIQCPSCGVRGEPKSGDTISTFEKKLADYRNYVQEILPPLIRNSSIHMVFQEEKISEIVTCVTEVFGNSV